MKISAGLFTVAAILIAGVAQSGEIIVHVNTVPTSTGIFDRDAVEQRRRVELQGPTPPGETCSRREGANGAEIRECCARRLRGLHPP